MSAPGRNARTGQYGLAFPCPRRRTSRAHQCRLGHAAEGRWYFRRTATRSETHIRNRALASSGLGLPVIGALLGHTTAQTTLRYSHLMDDPLRAATERASAVLSGRAPAEIVPLSRGRRSKPVLLIDPGELPTVAENLRNILAAQARCSTAEFLFASSNPLR